MAGAARGGALAPAAESALLGLRWLLMLASMSQLSRRAAVAARAAVRLFPSNQQRWVADRLALNCLEQD